MLGVRETKPIFQIRFRSRNSSENHNAFIENLLLRSNSDSSTQEDNNGTSVHTSNNAERTSQSSSDQTNRLLQVLLNKIDGIEDFLIKVNVKLDNIHQNERHSNKNQPTEIDISELKELRLPAESASDIEKLEENLKIKDFREKLVSALL